MDRQIRNLLLVFALGLEPRCQILDARMDLLAFLDVDSIPIRAKPSVRPLISNHALQSTINQSKEKEILTQPSTPPH